MLLLCIRGCEVNATDRGFVGRHGGDVRGSWREDYVKHFIGQG
jgi:hypothetical protein